MINIPHQKPIKFVNEVLSIKDDLALVSCSFPFKPTLAMFCEAAAQSSAVFNKDEDTKIGFLVTLKDIELLEDAKYLDYEISIKVVYKFDLLSEFNFEIFNNQKLYAKGNFIIKIQD